MGVDISSEAVIAIVFVNEMVIFQKSLLTARWNMRLEMPELY